MTIDIVGVGDPVTIYPDAETINFLSLPQYTLLAKKAIKASANRFRRGLAKEMLGSEDALSTVAHAIMIADWKYSGMGTIHGYRKDQACYAMRSYADRQADTRGRGMLSIDFVIMTHSDGEVALRHLLADTNSTGPERAAINKESEKFKSVQVQEFLECLTSDTQRHYITEHYLHGKTFTEIAKERGVSRQAVESCIKKTIVKMRKSVFG